MLFSRSAVILFILILVTVFVTLAGLSASGQQVVPVVNPGFEEVQGGEPVGWVPYGGGAINLDSQVVHSGQYSLHVMGNALQTSVTVKPNTGYRLSAWAKRDEAGLTGLWVGDSNLQPIAHTENGGVGMPAWSGPFDWERFELAFRTGDQSSISIVLYVNGGATVTAWFDDVMLVEDDTVRVGDVTPLDPPIEYLTEAEISRGYLVFSRPPLSRPYYTSIPTRQELTDTVQCKAAPGEYESALLMVRSLRGLTGLHLSITQTPTLQGSGAQVSVETRVVRPSIRRFSSISYEQLPLFLPLASTEDLATDTTRAYWLTFHVPEGAAPGVYIGTATLDANDAPETTVQLQVEVRPIRLLPTPIAFGTYYERSLLPVDYYSRGYQQLCYQDMKAHGMTSVTVYNHPLVVDGTLVFNVADGDRLSVDDEVALLQAAGIGINVPILYLGFFAGGPGSHVDIKQHQYVKGWPEMLFYICDEPGTAEPCSSYLQEYQGLPDTRTVTAGLNVELLGSLYSVWILSPSIMDEDTRQQAGNLGKELWAYDCQLHGATPQHDRYLGGLHVWAWNLRGLYQWAYTHFPDRYVTPEGVWTGTDDWTYGYVVAGPQGPIPTLGWEGRREGIDDYRYLYTLETLAAYGMTSENAQTRATAEEAQAFLNGVRSMVLSGPDVYAGRPASMQRFANDFIPQPEITPADYYYTREHAAELIARLSPSSRRTWDLSADFSATSNPNGQWKFLAYAGDSPDATYDDNTVNWPIPIGDPGSLKMWQHSSLPGSPSIFKNAGLISMITDPGGQTVLDPGQVGLHPYYGTQGDKPSAVRWTAPSNGEYAVNAVFSGRHISGVTTDVKVVKNGSSVLWTGHVGGWSGGSYWFSTPAVFGSAPVQTYSDTLTLAAGDYLDFVVAAGVSQSADSTGLSITIISDIVVPDPTWDLSADFSTTSNPNGPWLFLLYAGSNPDAAYTTNTAIWPIIVGDPGSLQMWYHWSLPSLPIIFKNAGLISMVTDPGGGTVLDPGQVGLHPRADGQGYYPSAVRWTAPGNGEYVVKAVFSGRHIGGPTTDVKVIKSGGGGIIWSGHVDGWFGTAPEPTYLDTLTLFAGEYLDFVVAAGVSQSADSTGLSITITPIGPIPEYTIDQWKKLDDGKRGKFAVAAQVTTDVGNSFFVESDDRSWGIRVAKVGSETYSRGTRATITGAIKTNADGERYISSSEIMAIPGAPTIQRLGMTNIALGGGDWYYDSATGAGQAGATGGIGLNNVGLFVTVWGRPVLTGSPGSFKIDDGSGVDVTVQLKAGQSHGWNAGNVPAYVIVTGASGLKKVSSDHTRVIYISNFAVDVISVVL